MYELRQAVGQTFHISLATSASTYGVEKNYDIDTINANIDTWNMMTYDYWVSDLSTADKTAPN